MWRWDIFCTVVDNYGDIGTCWRLARQLAGEHEANVRLWVDRLQTFAQLCPAVSANTDQQSVGQVEIRRWRSDFPEVEAADVVIEAFACELPESYIAAMARQSRGAGVDQLGIPQCGRLGRGLPSAAVVTDEMAADEIFLFSRVHSANRRAVAGTSSACRSCRIRCGRRSGILAQRGGPCPRRARTAGFAVLLPERVLARLAAGLGRRPAP